MSGVPLEQELGRLVGRLQAENATLRQDAGHAHSVIGDVVFALAGHERPDDLALSVLAVVRERDALRRQVAELRENGVSLHKASAAGYDAGVAAERTAVVA